MIDSRIAERLDRISRLGPDWDGMGAEAIDRLAVEAARRALEAIGRACPVHGFLPFPREGGAVRLEWWDGLDVMEIEFAPGGKTAEFFWFVAKAPENSDSGTFRADDTERAGELARQFHDWLEWKQPGKR